MQITAIVLNALSVIILLITAYFIRLQSHRHAKIALFNKRADWMERLEITMHDYINNEPTPELAGEITTLLYKGDLLFPDALSKKMRGFFLTLQSTNKYNKLEASAKFLKLLNKFKKETKVI